MKKYFLKKISLFATLILTIAMILTIAIFSTLSLSSLTVAGSNINVRTEFSENEKYTYPIQPGTEEWASLDHGERVIACQIPEEVLEKMSTTELAAAVLDYPCFDDMVFYSSYQSGFEVVKDHFNGLQELLRREDLTENLLNIYRGTDVNQLLSLDEEQMFDETLKLLFLETLLAQPEVRDSASEDQLNEISSIAEFNYNFQKDNEESIAPLSLSEYYESIEQQTQESQLRDIASSVRTPNGTLVAVGQKAYYPYSGEEHSGNVIRMNGNQIRSKWGNGFLVEHSVGNCPYFYHPVSVKFYGR